MVNMCLAGGGKDMMWADEVFYGESLGAPDDVSHTNFKVIKNYKNIFLKGEKAVYGVKIEAGRKGLIVADYSDDGRLFWARHKGGLAYCVEQLFVSEYNIKYLNRMVFYIYTGGALLCVSLFAGLLLFVWKRRKSH